MIVSSPPVSSCHCVGISSNRIEPTVAIVNRLDIQHHPRFLDRRTENRQTRLTCSFGQSTLLLRVVSHRLRGRSSVSRVCSAHRKHQKLLPNRVLSCALPPLVTKASSYSPLLMSRLLRLDARVSSSKRKGIGRIKS
jgi:hypothetical protein